MLEMCRLEISAVLVLEKSVEESLSAVCKKLDLFVAV